LQFRKGDPHALNYELPPVTSALNRVDGFVDRALYVLLLSSLVALVVQIAAGDCGADLGFGHALVCGVNGER
jgi:hypothetical protein